MLVGFIRGEDKGEVGSTGREEVADGVGDNVDDGDVDHRGRGEAVDGGDGVVPCGGRCGGGLTNS